MTKSDKLSGDDKAVKRIVIRDATFQGAETVSAAEANCRRWISCLSHEIRNPLTLIYSSLQIVEKEYPCVNDSPFWEQTKTDIQYLIRLLKDSSAAVREYQPEFSVFPVQDLFQELFLSARPLLEEHHILFDASFVTRPSADNDSAKEETEAFLVIRADRARLREALTNLVINAVDALSSMPDSYNRRISLTANAFSGIPVCADHRETSGAARCRTGQKNVSGFTNSLEDGICLHVRDNGPGIPDEYLKTLFDPFVTHKSNGTGLGLSIVRNIVDLHGGTISVETSVDKEASFTDFCLRIPSQL